MLLDQMECYVIRPNVMLLDQMECYVIRPNIMLCSRHVFHNVFNKHTNIFEFSFVRDVLFIKISDAVSILRFKFILLMSWPFRISEGNDAIFITSMSNTVLTGCVDRCVCVSRCGHTTHSTAHEPLTFTSAVSLFTNSIISCLHFGMPNWNKRPLCWHLSHT